MRTSYFYSFHSVAIVVTSKMRSTELDFLYCLKYKQNSVIVSLALFLTHIPIIFFTDTFAHE